LEEKKVIAYMKVVLVNDYTILDQLINSLYSFSYRYLIKDKPVGGVYMRTTELIFTYYNTTCKVYYNKNIHKQPLLIMNKYYQSIENILYNIAIKTTIGMSDYEFEKTADQSRMMLISYKDIKDIVDVLQKQSINYVVRKMANMNQLVKISLITESDHYLPIFVTSKKLYRGGDVKYSDVKIHAQCIEEKMSVYIGKSKMYTLPFWKCHQYDNMSLKRTHYIDLYPLNTLLQQRRIEKYLKQQMNPVLDIQTIDIMEQKIIEKIIEYTKMYKIYNVKWSNYLDDEVDVDLIDILDSSPGIERVFDKKYADLSIIPFVEKKTQEKEEKKKKIY